MAEQFLKDMNRPQIIERAFELAADSSSIKDLVRKLSKEGYSGAWEHLASPTLRAQLKLKVKASK